jgi:hypothetical protein
MILLIDIVEILSRFGTPARVKVSLASEAPRRASSAKANLTLRQLCL